MDRISETVEGHYGHGEVLERILRTLQAMGKDMTRLVPSDLAPVDEFHIRGREATIELANRAALRPGLRVLDVGSGLGGSARFLASEYRCHVTGIDLTREYVNAARALADLVGLGGEVEFRQANALDLPFADASFDVVWTEHAQMNIEDKRAFYGQGARVLKAGGELVFHDIFKGDGPPVDFPVPWAEEASISFLATPETARDILEAVGFEITHWEEKTRQSLEWFSAAIEKIKVAGPPPLGIHLLMGPSAKLKLENMVRNLEERRIVVFLAVARKGRPPAA